MNRWANGVCNGEDEYVLNERIGGESKEEKCKEDYLLVQMMIKTTRIASKMKERREEVEL